jgi:hypothetical protein
MLSPIERDFDEENKRTPPDMNKRHIGRHCLEGASFDQIFLLIPFALSYRLRMT